jgi:competence protein ComEC
VGLALSPLGPEVGAEPALYGSVALLVLAMVRPRGSRSVPAAPWLGCIAVAALACGLGLGSARVVAIDGGALDLAEGARVRVEGHVAAVPRRDDGEVGVRVSTPDGRLLVRAPEPVPDLPVGAGIRATGEVREPDDWERSNLLRQGVGVVLAVPTIELTGSRRGGVAGELDAIRSRAETALGRGTSPRTADLLRGFVLGQDDRIDPVTVDEFKRSGLAHLLAVSGQNVLLLAVLASAVLAVLGVPLRARLVWILIAIAVYVPVAGAGPSIQRAGIAGAAAVVAALASRPSSRWYAILLAAAATLALNPRASGDVGWQLSFAAVAGILLLAGPVRSLLAGGARGIRGALADGLAVTLSATLATAPLMAHHFGTASLVALPANVLALPAVAPVMWLGMLVAALGQVHWVPVEPLTWLAGALAGYIAQIAAWLAAPSWSQVDVSLPGAPAVTAALAALGAGVAILVRWARRRAPMRVRPLPLGCLAVVLVVGLATVAAVVRGDPSPVAAPTHGLRMRFLDVGQGDAILLEPAGDPPILVDAGVADAGVAEGLAASGVDRLAALVVTHPESDHAGGVPAVLHTVDVDRVVFARLDRRTLGAARAAASDPTRVAAGDRLRVGHLRLDVLWPPPARLAAARGAARPLQGDPNEVSLVMRVRWHGFDALLTGDAEAELAPVRPGPVELLKVAHHGSEDPGLAALLERTRPRVAVISVGSGNSYGHPAPATLATLERAGVRVVRTDEEGEVVIDVEGRGWQVH